MILCLHLQTPHIQSSLYHMETPHLELRMDVRQRGVAKVGVRVQERGENETRAVAAQ